jgi:hypothetical protein
LDLKGRKWQEAREDGIIRSFITSILHKILLGYQVKEDEMGGAWSTHGRNGDAYNISGGKPGVKRPLG